MALTVVTPTLYDGEAGKTGRLGRIMIVGTAPYDISYTSPSANADYYPFGTDSIIEIDSNYVLPDLLMKFLIKFDVSGVHGAQVKVTGNVYDTSKILLSTKSILYPLGGADNYKKQESGLLKLGPVTNAYYVGMVMNFKSRTPFTTDTFHVTAGMARLY